MVPDLALACPRCASALRPGAPWCTQCFLDVRPAPPAPPPAEVLPAAAPAADPAVPPAPSVPTGPPAPEDAWWPCAACGAVNPLSSTACAGCGAGFLDGAHAGAEPALALPVVGDLTRLSTAQRTALAAAVVVLVMLVTALLGLLTG